MDKAELTDKVYEAAFIPEYWPDRLNGLAQATRSASSALAIDSDRPPLWFRTALASWP